MNKSNIMATLEMVGEVVVWGGLIAFIGGMMALTMYVNAFGPLHH